MQMKGIWLIELFMMAWPCMASAQIDESKLVDLTHPFDEHTVVWPTNKPFSWEKTTGRRVRAAERVDR